LYAYTKLTMSHIPNPTQTEGTKTASLVADDDVRDLLGQVLKELKLMNIYLALISDVQLEGRDSIMGE